MTEGELALALENLKGELSKLSESTRQGFAHFREGIQGLSIRMDKHLDKCPECRSELQGEILANEREARKREKQVEDLARKLVSEAITQIMEEYKKHDDRLRKVENWKGKVMGVAVAVASLAAVITYVLEKVLP